MRYKPEVLCKGETEFCGNALSFATKQEAEGYAADLMWRWTAVVETRAVEALGDPTHAWVDGKLVDLQNKNS